MKKTGASPTTYLFAFFLFFIFVSISPLFSQNIEAPKTRFKKYPFTLSWVALDYAGWYIVEIENAKGKPLVNVRTTEPSYVFNAYPGQYRLKISVYNKLGTLEAASKWRPFSVVLPPRKVEEVEKPKEVIPRKYLILTHIEGMSSLGELGLDSNFFWSFSTMGTIAYTDFTVNGKSYENWTFGNHLYFSGKAAKESSFMDFIGSVGITAFTGYRLKANKQFSCIPFAEIGLTFPFLLENKDQGLDDNFISIGALGGFGTTFYLSFDKFFISTTLGCSINLYFLEGHGSSLEYFEWNLVEATVENGFNLTIGFGFLF